ncbi:MAG: PGPGW domain-containing protein [Nitrospirae bacterium]|nr:PGPGW domain-containing protein [Nitrospirota bacterium]
MKHLVISTVKQARRLILTVIGVTIILLGVIMLVTPGPGIPAIAVGLALLGTEFVWARKLLKKFKDGAVNVKNSVFNNSNKK